MNIQCPLKFLEWTLTMHVAENYTYQGHVTEPSIHSISYSFKGDENRPFGSFSQVSPSSMFTYLCLARSNCLSRTSNPQRNDSTSPVQCKCYGPTFKIDQNRLTLAIGHRSSRDRH